MSALNQQADENQLQQEHKQQQQQQQRQQQQHILQQTYHQASTPNQKSHDATVSMATANSHPAPHVSTSQGPHQRGGPADKCYGGLTPGDTSAMGPSSTASLLHLQNQNGLSREMLRTLQEVLLSHQMNTPHLQPQGTGTVRDRISYQAFAVSSLC